MRRFIKWKNEGAGGERPIKLPPLALVSRQAYEECWPIFLSPSFVRIRSHDEECKINSEEYFWNLTWTNETRKALQVTRRFQLEVYPSYWLLRSAHHFDYWSPWFRDVNHLIVVFASVVRKDSFRARASGEPLIVRDLRLDFGWMFRSAEPGERELDWKKALSMIDDMLLTARAGAEKDLLNLRVSHVPASAREDSCKATEKFKAICDKYGVPREEVPPEKNESDCEDELESEDELGSEDESSSDDESNSEDSSSSEDGSDSE